MANLQEREGDLEKQHIIDKVYERFVEDHRSIVNGGESKYIDVYVPVLKAGEITVSNEIFGWENNIFENLISFDDKSFNDAAIYINFYGRKKYSNQKYPAYYDTFKEDIYINMKEKFFWEALKVGTESEPGDVDDLIKIFKKAERGKKKYKRKGVNFLQGKGFKKIRKTMSYTILFWKKALKTNITHELQHLLDDQNYIENFDKSADSRNAKADKEGYYNSDAELEAYFRGASVKFFDKIKKDDELQRTMADLVRAIAYDATDTPLKRKEKRRRITESFRKLFQEFKNFIYDEFWKNLTKDNKRRIKKRMYTFLRHHAEDMISND